MKNRGFTLIELLAVIMIIGIIALVTTPLVMNQIEKSKKETLRDSIKGMVNAITYYQTENEIGKYKNRSRRFYFGNWYNYYEF